MPALSRLRHAALALAELALLQRKLWRHARHVAVYLLLLIILAWLIQPLKTLDWQLAERLDLRSRYWPAGVEVLDLEWDQNPSTLGGFRTTLAGALQALAALPVPPRLVVVDVTLSTVPLQLEPIQLAVAALRAKGVKIIGVAEPAGFALLGYEEGLRRQGYDKEIYLQDAELGHTLFYFNGNNFWYRPCEPLPPGPAARTHGCLLAVAALAAGLAQADPGLAQPTADTPEVLFQPGPTELLGPHRWLLKEGGLRAAEPGRSESDLGHAVVVVGNIEHDRVADRAGPEVLAWALGAALAPAHPAQPHLTPLVAPGWALGFALLFSGVQVGLFAALRRYKVLNWAITAAGVLSVAATLGLLALTVLGLRHGMNVVYVQVSYAAAAVLLSAVVAWHAARAALRDKALYTDISRSDPGGDERHYDVFISYSHSPAENMAWVERELAQPLKDAELDGRKLEVFFDKRSLGVGTAWYFELARAIESSDCFVAVYSSDYFQKNFCNFELGKAVVRKIGDQTGTFHVVPLMRGQVPLPAAFNHLQCAPAGTSQEMTASVLKVLQTVQENRRRAAARQA